VLWSTVHHLAVPKHAQAHRVRAVIRLVQIAPKLRCEVVEGLGAEEECGVRAIRELDQGLHETLAKDAVAQ